MSDTDDNLDTLSKQFVSAYKFLNKHPNINISNDVKLQLYGAYKVATIGACNTPRPSLLDFRGRAKWDAWNELGGISKEAAMNIYIEKVEAENVGWNKNSVDEDGSEVNDGDDEKEKSYSAPQDRWTYVSTLSYENEDDLIGDDIFAHVKQGEYNEVSKILDSGEVDINAKDDQGLSPLHWACDRGHLEIVKLLIERGANVNLLTSEDETPLHYACLSENIECARYLYRNNVDISIKDADGLTAFEHCGDEFKQLIIQD
ncbi:13236_t:CDS:2 [Acaulospora morrowiae]|uniref:13236_t:CDS:1 n=1 Tax=Acaulospora morrowiae TaxID=94023 RepID=A0A9N9GJM3_9GLOM|nr:13236_t:CDS:2 [Acaulospora morrowiae]